METNDLKSKLNLLKGNYFNIQGQKQKIVSVTEGTTAVVITTDASSYTPAKAEIKEWVMDKLFPVDAQGREALSSFAQNGEQLQVIAKEVTANSDQFRQLQDILMDNIKKVKEDKGYIPQASQINANVKTMIDITKTQVEMLKLMKR